MAVSAPPRIRSRSVSAAVEEIAVAGLGEPEHPAEGERRQEQGLDPQPFQRLDRRHLPQEPVDREAGGEGEADPDGAARAEREDCHARPGQDHRRLLQHAELLLEQEDPEQHVDERVQIITEAALQHMPADHRVDVDQPVDPDQGRGEQQGERDPGLARAARIERPFLPEGGERAEEEERPQDPVGDDLGRADMDQRLEVERKHAPQGIGAQPHEESGSGAGGVGHRRRG